MLLLSKSDVTLQLFLRLKLSNSFLLLNMMVRVATIVLQCN